MTTDTRNDPKPLASRPAAAAMIAAGIGALMLGILTTGAAISEGLKDALNFWPPSGSLTGKTIIALISWLISWGALSTSWIDEDYDLRKALLITLVLLALGVILTFPLVFEAFE